MYSLLPTILGVSLIFIILIVFYKMITSPFSLGLSNRELSEPMKRKYIYKQIVNSLIYFIFFISWINYLKYSTNIPSSIYTVSFEENNSLYLFILTCIIVLALITSVLFCLLFRSTKRLINFCLEYFIQQRSYAYNKLIHAIDTGHSKDMVEYFTVLQQSGTKIELSTEEWLTLLSTFVAEDETELSKDISQDTRGRKVSHKASPINKIKKSISS